MSRTERKQAKKKGKKTTPDKKKSSLLKKIVIGIVGLLVLLFVGGASLFAYYASDAPELTDEALVGFYPSTLYDKNGEEFHTLGAENREQIEYEEIPQVLEDAIISIEDQRFYDHLGVDPIRILGAVFANVTDGFGAEGGSTITQQLIKLSVFSTLQEDQTLERKAKEAWLAVQLEQELSKEQILALYVNKVYMSDNTYGMGTASEYYYGKPISELELHEAALFAGMPQSPNGYNPFTNPERAKSRRDTVLYVMAQNEVITTEEAETAMKIPVEEGLIDHSEENMDELVFDSYIQEVLEEVREKTDLEPQTAGLDIYTNIDLDAQQRMFDILNSEDYVDYPLEQMNAAMTMVDVKTGAVRAIGGGRNQKELRGFNYATENNSSVGSSMKPLTAYGPAIEYLQYSTYEQVVDEAWQWPGTDTTLTNYDNSYKGQMSIREALVDSRNVPAAKTLQEVGLDNAEGFVKGLGIDVDKLNAGDTDGLVASNAINGAISSFDLAAAYAAFGNNGVYNEPYTVSKVVMQDGREIELTPKSNKAMEESTAYMVTDMLKDVTNYYQSSVGIPGLIHAGKSGTSNFDAEDYKKMEEKGVSVPSDGVPDTWYTGYSTNYAISVWTGVTNRTEGYGLSFEDGSRTTARAIYAEIMGYVSESVDNGDWKRPINVVEVAVEDGSMPAKLPGPNTPEDEIVRELFIKGTEPTEESTEFGVELSEPTGLKATYDEKSNEVQIQWDAYTLTNEEDTPLYEVTINGETTETEDTSAVYTPSPGEKVTISVAVVAYDITGPAATTSVTVPGIELGKVTGLKATYNKEADQVQVNWDDYPKDDSMDSVTYSITINGRSGTTQQSQYQIDDPEPGSTVEIAVAVVSNGKTGPATTTKVSIPKEETTPQDEEEPEKETDDTSSQEPEEETTPDTSEDDGNTDEAEMNGANKPNTNTADDTADEE